MAYVQTPLSVLRSKINRRLYAIKYASVNARFGRAYRKHIRDPESYNAFIAKNEALGLPSLPKRTPIERELHFRRRSQKKVTLPKFNLP